MKLFNLLKRQINFTTEKNVSVEYINVNNIYSILNSTEENVILIKRILDNSDVAYINKSNADFSVFTLKPDDITALDALESLRKRVSVSFLKSIGLNFIYSGETLYVFSDVIADSKVPNMLKIYPIHKNIFEEKCLAIKDDTSVRDDTTLVENQHEKSVFENQHEKLICKKLKNIFDKDFTVIKTEFWGRHIEDKEIPLTRFYKRYDIASGLLKGSWRIFENTQFTAVLDKGVVKRAIDALFSEFSISLGSSYGRIIPNSLKDKFMDAARKIEKDYKDYLIGRNNTGKIRTVEIKVDFTPKKAVDESKNKLKEYLKSLKPVSYRYSIAVDEYVEQKFEKLQFGSNVKLKIISLTFAEDIWKDYEFIKIIKGACEKDTKHFSEEFKSLLYRLTQNKSDNLIVDKK